MRPLADLLVCLRFFSRLPLPQGPAGGDDSLGAAVAMVPVAALVIGLVPTIALAACLWIGLPPLLAATLSIATLVAVSGALHEDGLADCADGFGGGRTVARKLEIMRDSRIGTFGACALVLSLLCRITALSTLATRSPLTGAGAILAAAILSRTACLLPLVLLPPARSEGLGAFAGRPRPSRYLMAVLIAAILACGAVPLGFGFVVLVIAALSACLAAGAVCLLAKRQISGQTGDVCGAAQQAAEIAVLAVLSSR